MEKRNTLLLTVIAVATLLVAVVGATFAYFATTTETSNIVNVTATTEAAGAEFIVTTSKDIGLNVTAASMAYGNINDNSPVDTDNAVVTVSYKSGTDASKLKCTYDLIWTWKSEDTYTDYSNPEMTNQIEFGLKVEGKDSLGELLTQGTNGFASEHNLTELDLDGTLEGVLVSGATIENQSSTSPTVQTWTIDTSIYNLNFDQSIDNEAEHYYSIADKNYEATISVGNIVCGGAA